MALRRMNHICQLPDKQRIEIDRGTNGRDNKQTVWLKHEMVLRCSCRTNDVRADDPGLAEWLAQFHQAGQKVFKARQENLKAEVKKSRAQAGTLGAQSAENRSKALIKWAEMKGRRARSSRLPFSPCGEAG